MASRKSFVVVCDSFGRQALSREIATKRSEFRKVLMPYADELRIAIEAGGETVWIYDCLKELGADVVVVNPTKVKLIAESRRKTDKIDAGNSV